MLRLALKSVRHNPKRLILTAIAVALGVTLVTATYTFTNAFSSGFNQLFKDIYSSVDVTVGPDADANVDPFAKEGLITQADLDEIAEIDGVSAVGGGVEYDFGALLNADGDAPLKAGPPTIILGWLGNERLDGSTLIDGRAPESLNEIVVDVDTFKQMKVDLGDTAEIATGDGKSTVTVVGTIRFGENNDTQTAAILYATADTVRELGGGLTNFSSASVLVDDGADPQVVAEKISKVLPEKIRALTAQDKIQEQTDALDDVLNIVNILALVFGLIALFVGAYIIVNTFRIIVTQRTRELGLLRAIGAHGSQIRSMILLEAATVGVIASTLGIIVGWGLALVITALVESASGNIFGAVLLPTEAVLWSYALGLAVTLIAALLPAIHASAISPMEALREAGTSGKKPLVVRNIVGAAMTLAGVAGVIIGLFVDVPRPWAWVAAGAVLIVLGVTLLAAQVLVPLAYGLRGLLTKLWGVNGKLAANNIRREPRRSANTAAALMIGVMLLALVATFAASIKDTFTTQLSTSDADLVSSPFSPGPLPQGAVDVISATDGVDKTLRLGTSNVTYNGADALITFLDTNIADGMFEFKVDRPLADIDGGVFIDPSIAEQGVNVGDTVTITGPSGDVDLTVTGLYLNKGDQQFVVDWATAQELWADPIIGQLLVSYDEGVDAKETTQAVKDALAEDFPLVQMQTLNEFSSLFDGILNLALGFLTALLGAALLVALLGVANTLLLSVTERTREIGLLRAVGVKRGAVWAMITLESVVMALFGTILGIVLGVGLGVAAVQALGDYGISRPVVPWLWIGIYTVLSLVAGVVAAIWPAYRASRLDILQAIAADG